MRSINNRSHYRKICVKFRRRGDCRYCLSSTQQCVTHDRRPSLLMNGANRPRDVFTLACCCSSELHIRSDDRGCQLWLTTGRSPDEHHRMALVCNPTNDCQYQNDDEANHWGVYQVVYWPGSDNIPMPGHYRSAAQIGHTKQDITLERHPAARGIVTSGYMGIPSFYCQSWVRPGCAPLHRRTRQQLSASQNNTLDNFHSINRCFC